MTYDSAWEASIRQLRSQDRLLAVRSLHYRVSQSEIKTLCKAKLSNKGVVFHWRQDGVKPFQKHLSWVFIEAETTAEREVAIVELDKLLVRGRPVKVDPVARRARVPLAQRRQRIAASAAGPSTTTTTTTTTATPVATMAPVEPPTPPPIVAALRVSAAPAANVAADSPSAPSSVIAAASNEIATTSISEETDEHFARRTQGVGMVPIAVRTKDDEESEDSDEE
ncbi:hypothetical protein MY4038_009971 [Beauveria bassiana]